jgi:hypothetical protein
VKLYPSSGFLRDKDNIHQASGGHSGCIFKLLPDDKVQPDAPRLSDKAYDTRLECALAILCGYFHGSSLFLISSSEII